MEPKMILHVPADIESVMKFTTTIIIVVDSTISTVVTRLAKQRAVTVLHNTALWCSSMCLK